MNERSGAPLEPYLHPSAWRAADMADPQRYTIRFDAGDVDEIDRALAAAKTAGLAIPALGLDGFPLPRLRTKLLDALDRLENGPGVVLLRGLPVERYGKPDSALIFWGLGAHFGPGFAQNAQGDMLGHVRDLGASRSDPKARGYQTRERLPFHNDSTDVVGLMCLNTAKSGGLSRVASSVAIHNELIATRPDLAAVLYGDFRQDRRGEEPPGEPPYFVTPFFVRHGGRLFVKYNRSYVQSAQRFPDVPPLTPLQTEALDAIDRLCSDPRFCLEMALEPGDMQFVCNHVVLHSRTAYEDWPEPARRRHLLRLWLRTPAFADPPPAFADRNRDMLSWQRAPRAPLFDVSDIQAELAH
jgi:hypothetical protein